MADGVADLDGVVPRWFLKSLKRAGKWMEVYILGWEGGKVVSCKAWMGSSLHIPICEWLVHAVLVRRRIRDIVQ